MAARVLWVIKGLGPGGAEHLLAAAAEAHDHERFHIECAFILPYKDHLVERLERAGVRCQCLSNRRVDAWWPWRLHRLIATGGYDIVHVHSPLPGSVARLATRTMRRSSRPRLVSTEHNAWGTFAWPTRWANRLTSRLDEAVFTVSDETRASMTGPTARRAVTLQHGIDVAGVRAQLAERERVRAELGISPGEVVVGTVANYREQKDYPNLLQAAKVVADREVPVRVVAVGQGPLAAEIEALRDDLHLQDRVILTGYRPDATRVMAGFDVFTLASRYEGLPVALMEALALGLPVVATRVGGVAETLTDGEDALLVPPGDPEALAAAWLRVTDDGDLRRHLAERSAARASGFDVSRAVRVIEDCYARLAPEAVVSPGQEPQPRARRSIGLDIRPATPDDRPAILELCRRSLSWNDDPRFERLFAWKHDDNAFGPSYVWVATDAGRIVGLRAFMRWEFQRDDETLSAVRAVDTATDPDYQGRGLFTAMTLHAVDEMRADGVDFVFNTPNDQSRPGYLKMGWRVVGRPPAAVRFTTPHRAWRTARSRVPADHWSQPCDAGEPFMAWFERHGDAVSLPGSPGGRVLTTRWTPDRLAWRFGLADLHYRVAPGDEPGSGVVFRVRQRGEARELVALLALGLAPDRADALASRAGRAAHADHVLRLGGPNPRRGFVPLPGGGPVLTWRALVRCAMPPLADWGLTMGDVELF